MRRVAILVVALLAGAVIAKFAISGTKYRRFTGADRCWTMPLYAGPAGPFVGYLSGGALGDPGPGPGEALDLTVGVGGRGRSGWRRAARGPELDVPTRGASPGNC